ncbi:MAG: N-acetyltransferase [Betaproteobacteria bacterium]|nr:MAG: N-acetyltransferase [Betaproteobacteria bacterium]
MAPEVLYSPLEERDIEELANALHSEAVYQYIGGMPTRPDFELWLRRSIAGPPSEANGERWINFTARLAATQEVIGRLEANIHNNFAEVAFLYNPKFWGRGYAMQGLQWLHRQLAEHNGVHSFWATTHVENRRSASLLLRNGYVSAVTHDLPVLYSYEAGDLVFTRGVASPLAQAQRHR